MSDGDGVAAPTGPAIDFQNVSAAAPPPASTPTVEVALVLDLGVALGYKADEVDLAEVVRRATEVVRAERERKRKHAELGLTDEMLSSIFGEDGLMDSLWLAVSTPDDADPTDHAATLGYALRTLDDASLKAEVSRGAAAALGGVAEQLEAAGRQCHGRNPRYNQDGMMGYDIFVSAEAVADTAYQAAAIRRLRSTFGLE